MYLEATKFKEANHTAIGKGYFNLPIFKGSRCFTSCWKVPFLKRIKLLFTGKIWLNLEHCKQPKEMRDMFGGLNYHQPTSLTVDYPFMPLSDQASDVTGNGEGGVE